MSRAIRLTFKKDGRKELYHFYKDLYRHHSEEELGVSMQALYNAVSDKKGNGKYENKKIKVEETSLLNWN